MLLTANANANANATVILILIVDVIVTATAIVSLLFSKLRRKAPEQLLGSLKPLIRPLPLRNWN